ncbi:multidrug efflux SMR transporter [Halobacillus kuroshimensis]|uniref:Multidrug efflux SMR transporter n=1 Tax=Halobacillus kuroshimensis TaxID=302481 RepID=A0ABS3DYH6_9BACI|nr:MULTISPECIES: multidrug efflux SMR transporter [Halobacillus]MBN8236374.1 multidrug efflux SMR transporter [Halobacillus kuroshimensis]
MAWFYLIIAGLCEVGWAFGLKFSNGFTNMSVVFPTLILMIVSFWMFSKSLVSMPVSTAYAIFTGIGAFGTGIVGMLFLGDAFSIVKLILLVTLISCIIGLKLVSEDSNENDSVQERGV